MKDINEMTKPIRDFAKLIEQFEPNKQEILKEISDINKQQQILLHRIEIFNFNACDGFKIAKELKALRLKRRELKNIYAAMQSFNSRFYQNNKGIGLKLYQVATAMEKVGWDGTVYESIEEY